MKRGKPIARTTRVKPVNKERKAAEFERTYGGKPRVEWGKDQPCLICGNIPSENAHVPSRSGMSRKGDAKHTVPLCAWHHTDGDDSLHALNKAGFNAKHGLDLDHEAAIHNARWLQHVATAHQKQQPASRQPDPAPGGTPE